MEKYKGYTIEITPDENPESPREWENLGTMVCFHKRYDLGDKHEFKSNDYNNWKEVAKGIEEKVGKAIILPLYLYDHSGLRMKIGSFQGLLPQGHAEFDSGQVGYIYCTHEKACRDFGKKRMSKSLMSKVAENLEIEVKTYDMYLAGGVVGYVVKNPKGEVTDSCWSYYSEEEAMAEAKSAVDYKVKEELKTKLEKTKAFVKHHVPLEARMQTA
jgi:hypothetical protein